jgi:hypothetical protein
MLGAMATRRFAAPPFLSGARRAAHRWRICSELGFLGIAPNQQRNAKNAPLILPDAGRL